MNTPSLSKPYTQIEVATWKNVTLGSALVATALAVVLYFTTAGQGIITQVGSFGAFIAGATVLLSLSFYAHVKGKEHSHHLAKIIALASFIALLGIEILLMNQCMGYKNVYCTLAGAGLTLFAVPIVLANATVIPERERFGNELNFQKRVHHAEEAENIQQIDKWLRESSSSQERAYIRALIAKKPAWSQTFNLAHYLVTGEVDNSFAPHPLIAKLQNFRNLIERHTHPQLQHLGVLQRQNVFVKDNVLWSLLALREYDLAKEVLDAIQQPTFLEEAKKIILDRLQNQPEGSLDSDVALNILAPDLNCNLLSKEHVHAFIIREGQQCISEGSQETAPKMAVWLLDEARRYGFVDYRQDHPLPFLIQQELLRRAFQGTGTCQEKLARIATYGSCFRQALELVQVELIHASQIDALSAHSFLSLIIKDFEKAPRANNEEYLASGLGGPNLAKNLILLASAGLTPQEKLFKQFEYVTHFPLAVGELLVNFIESNPPQEVTTTLMKFQKLKDVLEVLAKVERDDREGPLRKMLELAMQSQNEEFVKKVVSAVASSSAPKLKALMMEKLHTRSNQGGNKALFSTHLALNPSFLNAYLEYESSDPSCIPEFILKNVKNKLASLSAKALNRLLVITSR